MIHQRSEAISILNELYRRKVPFVCFTDFLGKQAWIKAIDEIDPAELKFQFPNYKYSEEKKSSFENLKFDKTPISFQQYKKSFNEVIKQIKIGNSYLTNLTFKTPIDTNLSLDDIFDSSNASYQIKYQDQFVMFSPETFVRIKGDTIYSYPMKGTIDAALPNAAAQILSDHKEMTEHVTIVDLIRNDLSQIARKVKVTNFRFLSTLKTSDKQLLQVSSEITGKLENPKNMGDNLFRLLPAGSISGAPKNQTLEIIKNAEPDERGFFTGICGCYDGEVFDSGVMIRYIEKVNDQLYYRSGGGITALSKAEKEYQEMIDKVYVQIS